MSFTQVATYLEIATPATPGADKQRIYPKPDGFWYVLNDAGVETRLSVGGGTAPADAPYLIKTAAADLPNAQVLGALSTGFMFVTTTTGAVTSIGSTGSGSVVLDTSPTLVTPTIASFANATHTHQNAAGGGSLDAAAIGSGTLDNARVNWAAPSALGSGTPAAVSATTITGAGLLSNTVTSAGATTVLARLINASSTASSAVELQFNPATVTTRYASIQGINDGSNDVSLAFLTGLGASITEKARLVYDGRFGVGTGTPLNFVEFSMSDSATTTVVDMLVNTKNSSGTPAAGFGLGVLLRGKSSTTNAQNMARWRTYWNVATHASRAAYNVLSAYDTAERDVIGWGASGSAGLLGFYATKSVAPIAQPAAPTAALTTITFTAPGTPDYAVQNLTNAGGFGFVTQDEGNSVLSVIANLQTRVAYLETNVLQALGLMA